MTEYIRCSRCSKRVSSPVSEDTVIRAWIECPECLQKQQDEVLTCDQILSAKYKQLRDSVRSYALHHPLDLKTPSQLQVDLLAIAGEEVEVKS